MKGFVFTIDTLFAAFVSITIALSFYLVLEKMEPLPANSPIEPDLLAALDKSGKLGSVSGEELASILSGYNRCGSLTLKTNGVIARETIACPCAEGSELFASSRSIVAIAGNSAEYSIATLRTCLK
jgi:hypothetical protein